jgi:hypothetical protein
VTRPREGRFPRWSKMIDLDHCGLRRVQINPPYPREQTRRPCKSDRAGAKGNFTSRMSKKKGPLRSALLVVITYSVEQPRRLGGRSSRVCVRLPKTRDRLFWFVITPIAVLPLVIGKLPADAARWGP